MATRFRLFGQPQTLPQVGSKRSRACSIVALNLGLRYRLLRLGFTRGVACVSFLQESRMSPHALPLLALALSVDLGQGAAIYGDDTRQEPSDIADAHIRERALASTAVQVPDAMIFTEEDGRLRFTERRLGEALTLCDDEAFGEQLAIGTCSATLVGADLLLTAGHCVVNDAQCEDRSWLFGFDQQVTDGSRTLTSAARYHCSAVRHLRYGFDWGLRWDFAFVALDRPVDAPYSPAPLAPPGARLREGDALFVASHPSGLPLKVDADARVLHPRNDEGDYFSLRADTFPGSSGGGVYRRSDGALVGIIARTAGDYIWDPSAACRRPLRLPDFDTHKGDYEAASYLHGALRAACEGHEANLDAWCQQLVEEDTLAPVPTVPPTPDDADTPHGIPSGGGGGCNVTGRSGAHAALMASAWLLLRRLPRRLGGRDAPRRWSRRRSP